MLDHSHRDGLLLVVAQLDFEGLVDRSLRLIVFERCLAALARDVERLAGVEAQLLVSGRVADFVFADEFELAVNIAPVEAHIVGRQYRAGRSAYGRRAAGCQGGWRWNWRIPAWSKHRDCFAFRNSPDTASLPRRTGSGPRHRRRRGAAPRCRKRAETPPAWFRGRAV